MHSVQVHTHAHTLTLTKKYCQRGWRDSLSKTRVWESNTLSLTHAGILHTQSFCTFVVWVKLKFTPAPTYTAALEFALSLSFSVYIFAFRSVPSALFIISLSLSLSVHFFSISLSLSRSLDSSLLLLLSPLLPLHLENSLHFEYIFMCPLPLYSHSCTRIHERRKKDEKAEAKSSNTLHRLVHWFFSHGSVHMHPSLPLLVVPFFFPSTSLSLSSRIQFERKVRLSRRHVTYRSNEMHTTNVQWNIFHSTKLINLLVRSLSLSRCWLWFYTSQPSIYSPLSLSLL